MPATAAPKQRPSNIAVTAMESRPFRADAKDFHEIRQDSDSEPAVEEGVIKSLKNADLLQKRWAERDKKEGKDRWVSPFDDPRDRPTFTTKGQCQTHMDKTAKARITQAKLTKQPVNAYTPQKIHISPKRTLTDYMTPEQAKYAIAAQESPDARKISRQAISGRGELKAVSLMAGGESQAIARMHELSDEELLNLVTLADNRGKMKLFKAARKLAYANSLMPKA